MAHAAGSPSSGFFYAPFKGNEPSTYALLLKRGEGVDRFGCDQSTAPEMQGGPGVWEHRIIGMCSTASCSLPRHGLVFRAGKSGAYSVYLDNLRLRHAEGRTTPLWTNGKDTCFRPIADSDLFTQVTVTTVPASTVHS